MIYKVSVVILNYLSYQDTIRCVTSIKDKKLDVSGIVIVDNNSWNNSYEILHKTYQNQKGIAVIRSKKNYGFAKGNNIGISYARKYFEAEFILLLNSDTEVIDSEYLNILTKNYSANVGVIGSKVLNNYKTWTYKHVTDISWRGIILDYIKRVVEYFGGAAPGITQKRFRPVEWPSGCALLLTPSFFKYYNSLYPHTFLYKEEVILALMLKKVNLCCEIEQKTFLLHRGEQSSKIAFEANHAKRVAQYTLQSCKQVAIVKLLPYFILKKLC